MAERLGQAVCPGEAVLRGDHRPTVLGAAALFWTAVINGLAAPPLLAVIMLVGANRRVMGHRVNGRGITLLGWCTVALMSAAGVGLFLT